MKYVMGHYESNVRTRILAMLVGMLCLMSVTICVGSMALRGTCGWFALHPKRSQ